MNKPWCAEPLAIVGVLYLLALPSLNCMPSYIAFQQGPVLQSWRGGSLHQRSGSWTPMPRFALTTLSQRQPSANRASSRRRGVRMCAEEGGSDDTSCQLTKVEQRANTTSSLGWQYSGDDATNGRDRDGTW
eukprot:2881660-Rhodomonas_salina.1